LEEGRAEVENQYARAVRPEGNQEARRLLDEVFEPTDRSWRGIGLIPQSGYRLRDAFAEYDAERRFDALGISAQESPLCIAGLVLLGVKKPHDCPAFGTSCTPERPLGAPMVSSEGACAAYYQYRKYSSVAIQSSIEPTAPSPIDEMGGEGRGVGATEDDFCHRTSPHI
jgi:hydrogenase expression/formation protein HypD